MLELFKRVLLFSRRFPFDEINDFNQTTRTFFINSIFFNPEASEEKIAGLKYLHFPIFRLLKRMRSSLIIYIQFSPVNIFQETEYI